MNSLDNEPLYHALDDGDATCYRPPQMTIPLVQRDIAAAFSKAPVTLLISKIGSGKTSLLLSHYLALKQDGAHVMWLSLGFHDNDVGVLRDHLTKAFILPRTLHDVEKRQAYFFIDGLELISQPQALALAESWIIQLAEWGQVFASVNAIRSADLHDARQRGLLQVFDDASLRMHDSEAAKILGDAWTLSDVERINRFVSGWATGLRLLASAPSATREQLTHNDDSTLHIPILADYFTDVLCVQLTEQDLSVLMDLSVLNRFNAVLLMELPDITCDWERVKCWVESDLLLSFDGNARDWVVFQPAFGCYLRHRLRQRSPERFSALKRFAVSWFGQQGLQSEVVRHAVGIPNVLDAARIIEQAGGIKVDVSNGPEVMLENYLPVHLASEFPLLFLGQIYHRIRYGKQHIAKRLFDEARELTQDFTVLKDGADRIAVRSWMLINDVVLDVALDTPITQEQIDALEAELKIYLYKDSVMASSIISVLAFIYTDASRYAEAASLCHLGLFAQGSVGTNKTTVFIRWHQASAAIAQDSIEKAVFCIEDARRLARIDCSSDSYEVLISQLIRGVLHFENNELDESWALLWPALQQVGIINGWVRIYAEAFATAAAVASLREGIEAAEKVIQFAESFAAERQLSRLNHFMAIARLRELIRAGQYRAANEILEAPLLQNLLKQESLLPYILVQQVLALLEAAHLMLELERPRDALIWLDKINKDFLKDADSRIRFSFRILAMRAAFVLRRYNAASEHLQAAVDIARTAGLIRRALDVVHHLMAVLESAQSAGRPISMHVQEWIEKIQNDADDNKNGGVLTQNKRKRSSIMVTGNCMLSPRESEIIALIAEGCISKEIANRFGISESTVKTHRKKIYEKLGVSTRSQAILRARELLII